MTGLILSAFFGWLLAGVLGLAVIAMHVGWAESRRRVRYLTGRLKAYRGSGRGEYEAERSWDTRRAVRRG